MRRRLIAALLACGGLLGGGLAAAGPASAHTAAAHQPAAAPHSVPAPNVTPSQAGATTPQPTTFVADVCDHGRPLLCWVTHGAGSQMTIENSGATFFYLATTTETNWYKFHVDGSSHCLDHSGTTLTVSNCTAGDDGQKWFATLEGTGQGCFFTPRDNLSATIHTYSEDDAKPLWVNNDTQLVFRDYTTALFTGC